MNRNVTLGPANLSVLKPELQFLDLDFVDEREADHDDDDDGDQGEDDDEGFSRSKVRRLLRLARVFLRG